MLVNLGLPAFQSLAQNPPVTLCKRYC